MYWRCPDRVMVSTKSIARIAWAWERRNGAQVVVARCGAGSIPSARRISQTVDGATVIWSGASSPWMRR
jgi:hypothetical protein